MLIFCKLFNFFRFAPESPSSSGGTKHIKEATGSAMIPGANQMQQYSAAYAQVILPPTAYFLSKTVHTQSMPPISLFPCFSQWILLMSHALISQWHSYSDAGACRLQQPAGRRSWTSRGEKPFHPTGLIFALKLGWNVRNNQILSRHMHHAQLLQAQHAAALSAASQYATQQAFQVKPGQAVPQVGRRSFLI